MKNTKKSFSVFLSFVIIISIIFSVRVAAYGASFRTVEGKLNYTYASQVLTLVNQERRKNGLGALVMTQPLTDGAMLRAAETTVSFSHTRPNGESCFTAFAWTQTAGENIAYGQRSPEEVMNSWMNSSGHRANILNGSFTTIGIGCFEFNGRLYWAQAFSGGKGNAYSPAGSVSAAVDVSMTAGTESIMHIGSRPSVGESTTKQAPTSTRQSQTTTRQAATTTSQAATTTRQVPTTTRQAPTTTRQSQTTTRQSQTTAKQAPSTTKPSAPVQSAPKSSMKTYYVTVQKTTVEKLLRYIVERMTK